jgi:hypothetical protein
MSLARAILEEADAAVNVPIHGSLPGQPDALTIDDDVSTPFVGIIDAEPEIIPEFQFDVDPREVAKLEIHNRNQVNGTFDGVSRQLDYNDIINQGQHQWRVIKREKNPAIWVTTYWLVKVVPGKDS